MLSIFMEILAYIAICLIRFFYLTELTHVVSSWRQSKTREIEIIGYVGHMVDISSLQSARFLA